MNVKRPRWADIDDKQPLRSDIYWESVKNIANILARHSLKEVKEILSMVGSKYGLRVISSFAPIGPPVPSSYRQIVGAPKSLAKAKRDTKVPQISSWRSSDKGKALVNRREEILTVLKTLSIDNPDKEKWLLSLRTVEADIKAFKNSFRGNPPLGSSSAASITASGDKSLSSFKDKSQEKKEISDTKVF